MQSQENDYNQAIFDVCDLLQNATTPEAIKQLIEAFNKLTGFLKAGPFLEIFEAILTNISFAALFSLLAAPDNRLIVSVVDLTERLLQPVTWDMIHEKFEEFIIIGLEHPHPRFNPMYSTYIWSYLKGETDSELTTYASNVLNILSKYPKGIDELYTESSLTNIRSLLNMDTSHRFLVYEIMSSSILNSPNAVEYFKQEGLLEKFVAEFQNDDPLALINAMELVPVTCKSEDFSEYLVTTPILSKISHLISPGEPEFDFLKSAALKTFSRLSDSKGLNYSQVCIEHSFFKKIVECMEQSNDTTLKLTTIECLGILGFNPDVLRFLSKEKLVINAFTSIFESSAGSARVECYKTLSCILEKTPPIEEDISEINHNIYISIKGGNLLPILVRSSMEVFQDVSFSALSVLQKLGLYKWGQRELSQSQQFTNLILDTSRDSLFIKELKLSIASSIVASSSFLEMFPEDSALKLKRLASGKATESAAPQVALDSV
ncbi:hypothetical protein BB558_000761 [Smittium angustum]|uniref:26S proteasome non-ATPase regulatory subunit 5 n=1 Tax=Smittium angustum TaxID=133377 RepID=A0A2U1JDP1_SMIAN|nr:hypothetical protein BB558_000761 [Smittium angustum]